MKESTAVSSFGAVCRPLVRVSGGFCALALAGWLMFPAAVGAQTPNPMAQVHVKSFPDCCPRPAWWEDVEIDRRIGSRHDFDAVWRDDALTDEQKAKAMFRAIEEFNRSDDDITVPAITYFYWVGRDYSHLRELYEFGVARYLDFDQSLENYSGEVGDLSAGMVNTLSRLYLADGEPERAVPLLRYILEVREDEVNDHILETAARHLGNALSRLDRDPEAIEVLLAARRDYDGDWEAQLDDQLAKIRDKMGLAYYLHDQRQLSLLLGAFVFALLVVYMLRRWRRRRGDAGKTIRRG